MRILLMQGSGKGIRSFGTKVLEAIVSFLKGGAGYQAKVLWNSLQLMW